ncbi:NAD(P)/FAD-dependent oxidoreductase [uncultured Erythrobacter sp.]|uniref:NAD(P)/FAD-dependent oxidoreductase n=1 Tax=uncultured Erythrobacter sp. TaxID=263913 RepID=UPI0026157109|nr:NAD(P)/FAD-dependent oxidoreductase [uncultured Erythrobacter sp.]
MEHYDAIILGAGAAGLMCAAQAGKRGLRVVVLEKADKPGKKILISGGGRCNFTNVDAGPANYLSDNPHFAKSALARYTPQDFIELVNAHGIAWHEKTLGQLFCDGSAKQIVQMLLDECGESVDVLCDAFVSAVVKDGDAFAVSASGQNFTAPRLVIASGGPSIPKMGATGFAYDLARQFGLKVVEPRPALVPLTLGGEDVLFRELSGVSAPVTARAGNGKRKASFDEAALFTHKGLSGPAILQISSYWHPGEEVGITFLPQADVDWLLELKRDRPRAGLKSALREHLPDRLADALAERLGIDTELGNISDKTLRAAGQKLADWRFTPSGTEGFAKAEVTIGGISTNELSSKTMEAKSVPGLYVIGEAVDVTGWLGGYNFQWAWASGVACAEALGHE